jgi:hypothetical protein
VATPGLPGGRMSLWEVALPRFRRESVNRFRLLVRLQRSTVRGSWADLLGVTGASPVRAMLYKSRSQIAAHLGHCIGALDVLDILLARDPLSPGRHRSAPVLGAVRTRVGGRSGVWRHRMAAGFRRTPFYFCELRGVPAPASNGMTELCWGAMPFLADVVGILPKPDSSVGAVQFPDQAWSAINCKSHMVGMTCFGWQ